MENSWSEVQRYRTLHGKLTRGGAGFHSVPSVACHSVPELVSGREGCDGLGSGRVGFYSGTGGGKSGVSAMRQAPYSHAHLQHASLGQFLPNPLP